MKKIPLKTVQMSIRTRDEPIPLDYAEMLLIILEASPERGFTPAEMRIRLPIEDRVEAAQETETDHVLLEDAQHKKLAALVDSYSGFRVAHYAIVEFVDAVKHAPDVEVEEAANEQSDD